MTSFGEVLDALRGSWSWLGVCAVLVVPGCKKDPQPEQAAPKPSAAVVSAPSAGVSASGAASSAPAAVNAAQAESAGVRRLDAAVGAGEEFGYAVAAGAERVAVTAFKRKAKTGDAIPGSVLIYKRQGDQLALETELVSDKSRQLGNALVFDGTTLVAGALYDDGASPETGAAYAFTWSDSGWSPAVKLTAAGGKKDDSFGIGLALAGATVVTGNSREAGGSLFTFERKKAGLERRQTVPFAEPSGPAEAIAAHGDWIAVGAELAGKLEEQGAVQLYQRGPNGFAAGQRLTETDAAESQHFGGSVAMHGTTLAVASEKQLSIFELHGGRWQERARITPPLDTGLADAALAVGDGAIAVGLPRIEQGRVLVLRRRDGSWKHERTLQAPDGKNEDWFGHSVALGDGLLVVGAPLKDDRTGAAYFVRP